MSGETAETEPHRYVGLGGCSCGWLADFDPEANAAYRAAHRAHVAEVTRATPPEADQ